MADNALHSLCIKLGDQIRQRHGRLITIESCTGGGVAQAVTEVAGSSDWFDRALITYSNQAKTALAAVPAGLITEHGAVSIEVAESMATGGLKQSDLPFESVYSIAVTGVAGPSGGSAEKPVGLVCFAWGCRTPDSLGLLHSCKVRFDGDRAAIREQSIQFALEMLSRKIGAPL